MAVMEANGAARKKTIQLRTDGTPSVRASIGALWGPKQLDNLVDLDLSFDVIPEKSVLRRQECEVGNQYVLRSFPPSPSPFFFDMGSSHWSVRYV
jgi:hypothetical protein